MSGARATRVESYPQASLFMSAFPARYGKSENGFHFQHAEYILRD
jgi:hypothetical protein